MTAKERYTLRMGVFVGASAMAAAYFTYKALTGLMEDMNKSRS